MRAEIITKKGTMKVAFFEQDAPTTVENFCTLDKKGFYDGLTFHRVIPNFVIQGGCPKGNGTGGPGYKIKCELSGKNQYHDRGVLSMAHAGKDTGGSQFFICLSRANTQHLDKKHTVFARIIGGLEVIESIRTNDVIEHIKILDDELSDRINDQVYQPVNDNKEKTISESNHYNTEEVTSKIHLQNLGEYYILNKGGS